MTAKAPPSGWVVQVTVSAPLSSPGSDTRWIGRHIPDAPSFHYFNVALASPVKAVEATAAFLAKGKAASDTEDAPASAVRELSAAEVTALGLKSGEVKLA